MLDRISRILTGQSVIESILIMLICVGHCRKTDTKAWTNASINCWHLFVWCILRHTGWVVRSSRAFLAQGLKSPVLLCLYYKIKNKLNSQWNCHIKTVKSTKFKSHILHLLKKMLQPGKYGLITTFTSNK